ncbi:receptor-transporting protein 3-like [Megalops cyprinoides]|uniref:receptor-transporting protein 3-like n=1 Tax=Megalops cyprinoides TaxID=118141 RepID=UPI00186518A1|nr:receptor-transporting protein 3-like [Megalops cyprinoides]
MSDQDWHRVFNSKAAKLNKPDSWKLLFDDTIEATEAGWGEYIRSVFSRFSCSCCGHKWASSKVQMVFHMRLDTSNHQGTVRVRRYRQNCKTCPGAAFEKPTVSTMDLEKVMDKLMEKILVKCYQEESNTPSRPFQPERVLKGPHLSGHCEACIKGICTLSG